MVKGLYVVVNVMLSLMSVMSPPPALCNVSTRTVVKLCMVVVIAGYVGVTRGSGILSSAADVL